MLVNPYLATAVLYMTTAFGAAAMYVFSLQRGFDGSVRWLRRMWPERSDVFYDRLDFLIVVFAGSIIGSIVFSPREPYHALAAGFGWVGAVNVLINRAAPGGIE